MTPITFFRQQLPHVPIILMSGNLDGASRELELARELGPRVVMQKPLHTEELLQAVRTLIG